MKLKREHIERLSKLAKKFKRIPNTLVKAEKDEFWCWLIADWLEHADLIELLIDSDATEDDYQKMIAAVLECDPIPASKRGGRELELPWDVIRRIKRERDRYASACIEHSEVADEAIHRADRYEEALKKIASIGKSYKPGSNRWRDAAHEALNAEGREVSKRNKIKE